ncbi:polyhomeotic-like protein 2 [Eudromia elegans]
MENEQLPAPGGPGPGPGPGRAAGPQISVYGGLPDRQTVQVIQQALHRQPSTAAQYLQQMYAAQQQHLMLQTAALQQQHLTSAQLQSLAAVQQASLAANRQSGPPGGSGAAPAPQPTLNLAAAPAAAQLLNRAQGVGPAAAAASGIAQQAVLLGNAAAPALSASQAQMYLRAQMLIFTPTATVTAVRPESPAAPAAPPPAAAAAQVSPEAPPGPPPPPAAPHPAPLQVQNLALRPPAAAAAASPHLPALAMKPPGPPKPAAPKSGPPECPAEHLKKGEGADGRAHPLARAAAPAAAAHPLVAPAYAQLQPHQFLQQQQNVAAAAAPHNGEGKPPQAVVKPQILTHVIEGFVIQEGAEPFPVGRSSLLVGSLKHKYAQELPPEKLPPPPPPPDTATTTTDSDMEEPYAPEPKDEGNPPKLKCELCGRVDFAYKFKRSKRFCSMACAKRYNVGCTKRVGLFHPDRSKLQKPGGPPHGRRRSCKSTLPALGKEAKKQSPVSLRAGSAPRSVTPSLQLNHSQEDSSRCSDNSSYEEPLSPLSASSSTSRRRQGDLELRDMELPDVHVRELAGLGHRFLPSEPSKWNVEDVYEFIRSLPGCQEIAEEFRAQEIDGQALLLLKEDHLMSTMNIKLGPALKIYARISMLKDS